MTYTWYMAWKIMQAEREIIMMYYIIYEKGHTSRSISRSKVLELNN